MQLDPEQVTTHEVKRWKGLHLLHFPGSSCSQKVRILLAEKLGIAGQPLEKLGSMFNHAFDQVEKLVELISQKQV